MMKTIRRAALFPPYFIACFLDAVIRFNYAWSTYVLARLDHVMSWFARMWEA